MPSVVLNFAAKVKIDMTIEKIFSEVFGLPESSIIDTLILTEIGSWDSLAHMILITRLEDTYQIQFNGDQIADMKSVGDARKALLAQGANI
ncbi:acyl carrier protein [Undibacterium pigrum]|uniref:Acyl carrier protein n=2 Tax=Undibacterium pigrum TaxID=401470 RepID=A0A318JH88_9BURK|nr:acyl carrier protein [Undibacterium pigrum]